MPGELAAEERSDEPRVPSVRSNGAAAARDAGGVPDAPRVEPAHRDAGNVAQRVPVIRRPFALRHPVPRRLVRIDHEGQVDVRVLSGHELVKRVRDDVFRYAGSLGLDSPSEPTGLTLATREPGLFLFARFERRFRSKWNISGLFWGGLPF